jgi:aminocarboxymuconate-semialdehyde decarboxylase
VSGAVDCHAHYVSPRVLQTLASADPGRYGVSLEAGAPVLRIGGTPSRPLPAELRDLSRRGDWLAEVGLGVQAIGTWMDVTGYDLPPEQGAAWSRLLNDSVAEDLRDDPRYVGLASLPMQDGRLAAAELDYAVGRLGFRGAMIGTNVNGRGLDDASLDPVWHTAQAADVPIVLHPYLVAGAERMRQYWLANLVGNPLDTAIAAASLIFGGVLDRFPELRLLLVHGGGSIPFQIGRLQRGFAVRQETKVHGVTTPPLDYLRRFHYDTVLFHPPALRYLLETVGEDRVVVGSDYPFDLGDPRPLEVIKAAGLPDRVLVDNGSRLLGLV